MRQWLYNLLERPIDLQALSTGVNKFLVGLIFLNITAATIFLPLSFLTGLMGINIGGMPGVDTDTAFWLFTLFCVILVLFQILIFKKFKWF